MSFALLHDFPHMLPTSPDLTSYAGFITAGDHQINLHIELAAPATMSGARYEGGTKASIPH